MRGHNFFVLLVVGYYSFPNSVSAQEQNWVLDYSIKGVDLPSIYLTLSIDGSSISGTGKTSVCLKDLATISGTIEQEAIELVLYPDDRVKNEGQGLYFSGYLKNETMTGYWSMPYNLEKKSAPWVAKKTELSEIEVIKGFVRGCSKPT
ncbi:hypothetical protein ACFFUS_22285 [Vibrio gallaecicus]|uniref:hypothetical protein n=1 Tax=Vibrio gallaecicus TaxID=552386 RepID=UPI0010CA00BC|nr:hypothetical protein [Vibrio gallaecicus]MDN3617336.1 hypothetical protein [Vibrio gallaecicus]